MNVRPLLRSIPILFLAVIPLAACSKSSAEPQAESPRATEPASRTSVVLLGTGTPNAEPARSGPALAVVVDDESYLVDAGPGVVRRATAALEAFGIAALDPSRLRRVFITHLHSDHTVGLPDLIYTPWVLERRDPLEVFGPPGVKSMCEHIAAAWAADVDMRTNGLEHANPTGWKTVPHEIERAGVVYRDERVRVTAILVPHGQFTHAFAYRFDTPDRVVVVSGDTGPSKELMEAAKDCDVLVHEVYSHAMFSRRPASWQTYHKRFHTSTVELAELAKIAKPKLLVLTHLLTWGAGTQDLVSEVEATYDGAVVCGEDLGRY